MKSKRIFAILLAITMVLTYMPALAFADTETASDQETPAAEDLQVIPEAEQEPVSETEPQTEGAANSGAVISEEELVQEETEAVNGKVDEPADIQGDNLGEPELTEGVETVSAEVDVSSSVDLEGNDELLMEYLEKGMPQKASAPGKLRKAAPATRGSRLEGNNKTIYDILENAIKALTDNNADTSAEFSIKADQLSFEKTSFTKEELEVDALVEGEYLTEEATSALIGKMGFSHTDILDALLCDMPYYLYWFDKTKETGGLDLNIRKIGTEINNGDIVALTVDNAELTFSFTVASGYRDNNAEVPEYTVDNQKIIAANTAKATASGIITQNTDNSDIQKLKNYKDEICRLTSYNDAAGDKLVPYGDPWQMISVFDNNENTEVVCEGYSKAFQFLCDNSTFENNIECDSVTGTMTGGTGAGDHMWNILHMEDGSNYIADITNCDKGTVGAADEYGGPYLFLTGCKPQGSVANGYTYSCRGGTEMFYEYDADTKKTFSEAELTMSETGYQGNQGGDEGHYSFEFAGEEGAVERLYSDENGTIQYKLPDEAVIPESDNDPLVLRVGINTGEDNENHGWLPDYDFTEGKEFTFDRDTKTLNLIGSEVYNTIGNDFDYITFFAGVEEGTYGGEHFDGWMADGGCEFRIARTEYQFPDDRDMLIGWNEWISAEDNAWTENSQYPDGADVPYEVTGVVSSNPAVVSIEAGEDGDGWNCKAKALGEAVVTLTYRDVIGEDKYGEEDSYIFHISVTEDVYVADLWINNDSDKFLPGNSVELETRVIHYNHELEDGEADITKDVDLTWNLPDDGTDYASIDPREGEENKAVVTFKSKEDLASAELLDEGGNLWRDIQARVVVSINGENIAARDQRLTVSTDYMDIAMIGEGVSFGSLADLEVGESLKFGLELRNYSCDIDNDDGYRLVENAVFSWEYDENCASITGPDQQGKYTVTRLDSFDGWMKVTANWQDDQLRKESRDMHFNHRNYDFWFEEHDINVFTDEESAEVELNVGNFGENFDNRFNLRIDAGRWDENSDTWIDDSMLTVDEDYTVSGTSEGKVTVTLNKRFISSVEDYDDIRIEARILIKGTEKEIGDGEDCWFHLKLPRAEYDYETEREILPGWEGSIDGQFRVYIENSEFPDGKDSDYVVTNVEIIEGENLLQDFHKDTGDDPNDYWWYYRVKDFDKNPIGNVKFKVTYTDPEGADGNEGTYEFVLHIQNEIYEVHVDSADGRYKAFPDGEIGMTAWATHKFLDKNGEYHETYDDFTLEWGIAKGGEFATVTSVSGNQATVKFKSMPEGWNSIREEVEVRVALKKDGSEKSSDNIRLWCESDYLEMVPARLDSRLHVGASTEPIKFELRRYDMFSDEDEDGYTVIPVEKYEFYYDEKAFAITDSAGNAVKDQGSADDDEDFSSTDDTFTITRKGDWGTDIHVNALWQEGDGWEDFDCDYHFDNLDYDLWFDEHDMDVFTDAESIAADLDVSGLADGWEDSLTLDLTVGVWDDDKKAWAEGGILTKDTDYTVSGVQDGRITVSLKKSYYETLTEFTNIRLVAKLMGGSEDEATQISDTDAWFHVRVPETDWAREYDMNLLPGWYGFIDSEYELTFFNSEHPDGDYTSYTVTGAAVTGQEPAEEGTDVIKIEEADDGWKLTALHPGKATVTVTHSPFAVNGAEQTSYTFDAYVGSDVYRANIVNNSNNWDGLPGDTFKMEADAVHFYLDENGEQQATKEGLTYEWVIRSDAEDLADITVDSSDPSKAVLAFKSLNTLPDDLKDQDWFERQVNVTVRVRDTGNTEHPDDVMAEENRDFRMTKVYEEVKPTALSDEILDLKPGESADIIFSTVTREAGEEETVRDDVIYRIYFDQNNPLTVKDAEGNSVSHGDRIIGNKITITRTNALSTALGVRAEVDNSEDPDDFRILGFRNYQFNQDEAAESERIDGLAEDAKRAAGDAADKAATAAEAVAALKIAAEEAKAAADKAAQSLDAADIADAQEKATAAKEAQTLAKTAIDAAETAKAAADEAIRAVNKAIEAAEKQHVSIDDSVRQKVNDASDVATNTGDNINAARNEKASQDAVVAEASQKADKAASDKAAADKAAADKAAADKAAADKAAAAKAAAEKAEADRKAAEFAANGYGYIDPTLPKVKIQKPKAAKKSLTAKWKKIKNKKQLKMIKGIEVEYSLTPDFQDPKFKTASKKKTNVKIKKLLSKKTYYVRAHTYVIRDGVKYVSYWSATKKVKVK